ncbi:TetR/AcrR family transcriptional regulator [Rhodococcus zopfii]|uniref:TetR/AcrR family transcriptional regulator n=1 Tax=Rhodococcus zopfii TaxID=43772 RepID=UPI00364916BD
MTEIRWFDDDDSTATRILKATTTVLGRRGRTGLNLSEVAAQAGVSRPTLYRLFSSKDKLLDALGRHERQVVHEAVRAALAGTAGAERVDALLRFIADFTKSYPLRHLIEIEPSHELGELTRVMPVVREWVRDVLGDAEDSDVIAGAVVRVALCHYLVPGDDDDQFYKQLRRIVDNSPQP